MTMNAYVLLRHYKSGTEGLISYSCFFNNYNRFHNIYERYSP